MSPEMDRLLLQLQPASQANWLQRMQCGLAVCDRVAHLIEQTEVLECIDRFRHWHADPAKAADLEQLGQQAALLANGHPGSRSLDGVGHAAVSATYACAMAIQGRIRQAVEYAAYAMVYGQGGYGATTDPGSFEPEWAWLASRLQAIIHPTGLA